MSKKNNLENNVNDLKAKLNVLGASERYKEYNDNKKEIKDLKKESFKKFNIKNLKVTGAVSLIVLPIVLIGIPSFVLFDSADMRPYVPDEIYSYRYEIETVNNNGEVNQFYVDQNMKYDNLYNVKTPWNKVDNHYERLSYTYNMIIKDEEREKYLNSSEKILKQLEDPISVEIESKDELDKNDSLSEATVSITTAKKNKEVKTLIRKESILSTGVYSALHLAITLSGSLLSLIVMNDKINFSSWIEDAKKLKKDRNNIKERIKILKKINMKNIEK